MSGRGSWGPEGRAQEPRRPNAPSWRSGGLRTQPCAGRTTRRSLNRKISLVQAESYRASSGPGPREGRQCRQGGGAAATTPVWRRRHPARTPRRRPRASVPRRPPSSAGRARGRCPGARALARAACGPGPRPEGISAPPPAHRPCPTETALPVLRAGVGPRNLEVPDTCSPEPPDPRPSVLKDLSHAI